MRRVKVISLALAAVLAGAINLAGANGETKKQASGLKTELASATSKGKRSTDKQATQLLSRPGLTTTTTAPPPPAPTPAPPAESAPVAAPVLQPEPPPPPVNSLMSVPWAPMVCPVQVGPGELEYIDSWGYPRAGHTHKGTDMMAPMGSWTVAPVDGVVTHGSDGLGGLTWHLYGDDGNMYYGAHLSAYENADAGWVMAGTVIGYVGDTGNAAGGPSHLHFEFHPGGGEAAPSYDLLTTVCGGGH